MNQVILIGRVVADPELKFTKTGKAVANMRIAVNRTFDRETADFFKVTIWGKQAEAAATYLKKGAQCAISGRVEINQYEDRDGNARYSTDIIAQEVEFLGGKSQRSSGEVEADVDQWAVGESEVPF